MGRFASDKRTISLFVVVGRNQESKTLEIEPYKVKVIIIHSRYTITYAGRGACFQHGPIASRTVSARRGARTRETSLPRGLTLSAAKLVCRLPGDHEHSSRKGGPPCDACAPRRPAASPVDEVVLPRRWLGCCCDCRRPEAGRGRATWRSTTRQAFANEPDDQEHRQEHAVRP